MHQLQYNNTAREGIEPYAFYNTARFPVGASSKLGHAHRGDRQRTRTPTHKGPSAFEAAPAGFTGLPAIIPMEIY